ncbi:hypothetical protein PAPYR_11961 [Paratrimastix pyriformis]|uniref:Uncharacterized protein n=1 Tax=Paratrimastix pyriformis TaxID=342808 RepID=A0ABQ8U6S8_9EUKA|nr:hypothetical protein PAPYR_11961 [Paratrimastix pyriformis]
MDSQQQASIVEPATEEERRTYQRRNIALESTDPIERRREYKKKYTEVVKDKPTHKNKHRNIVLTETDPVKRAAEYRRKYKAQLKVEAEVAAPLQFETRDHLAAALREALAAITTLPADGNTAAELIASTIFAHVRDNCYPNRGKVMVFKIMQQVNVWSRENPES